MAFKPFSSQGKPAGKKKAGKKAKKAMPLGDEGMPFVPAGKRKAGMGDEGLPLKKGKKATY